MPTGEKGKSYKENMEYHRGTSWKAKLRVAVDKAIWTSINYEEFLPVSYTHLPKNFRQWFGAFNFKMSC